MALKKEATRTAAKKLAVPAKAQTAGGSVKKAVRKGVAGKMSARARNGRVAPSPSPEKLKAQTIRVFQMAYDEHHEKA